MELMTFSGDFDSREVIDLVRKELRKMGLFLNDKKTIRVMRGQRQSVTGIVVNEGRNCLRKCITAGGSALKSI